MFIPYLFIILHVFIFINYTHTIKISYLLNEYARSNIFLFSLHYYDNYLNTYYTEFSSLSTVVFEILPCVAVHHRPQLGNILPDERDRSRLESNVNRLQRTFQTTLIGDLSFDLDAVGFPPSNLSSFLEPANVSFTRCSVIC